PKGRAGGRDGAMARTVIYRAGGGEEVVPSKLVTTLHVGDRVVFETAGGGGYGDPTRRDAQKVRADLADGKISTEGANIYGPSRHGAGRPSCTAIASNVPRFDENIRLAHIWLTR